MADRLMVGRLARRTLRACGCLVLVLASVAAAVFVVDRVHNRPVRLRLPAHVMPSPNARDYFLRAAAMAPGGRPMFPNSSFKRLPETPASYAPAAKAIEPALRAARRGLASEYGAPLGALDGTEDLEANRRLRQLARDFQGMSQYERMLGHRREACDWAMDCVEMGVLVQHGATMPFMVGEAIQAIGCAPLAPLVADLSPDVLAHASVRADKIEARRVDLAAMITMCGRERVAIESGYFPRASRGSLSARWRMYRDVVYPEYLDWFPGSADPLTGRQVNARVLRLALADKRALLLDEEAWHRRLAGRIRRPYRGTLSIPNSRLAQMRVSGPCVCSKMPIHDGFLRAVWAVIRVEIALRRFRAERGACPAQLMDLRPRYLRAVPADPCGGAPLHYRRLDGGRHFELYSVGPDLRDDGGMPMARMYAAATGDLVAGKLWRRRDASP